MVAQFRVNPVLGCEAGLFLSLSQERCLSCPENTIGTLSGVSVCPCVEGYFRRADEGEQSCTSMSWYKVHASVNCKWFVLVLEYLLYTIQSKACTLASSVKSFSW